MKVALVHDWLTGMRGGEKVLEALCEIYPDADLFTLVHRPGSVSKPIEDRLVVSSMLQALPRASRWYRYYLPLMPTAIESLDVTDYDLVISSSHCVAKGVIPRPDALQVCYLHTPMRYAWDQWPQYFARNGTLGRVAISPLLSYLRTWDVGSSNRVHQFIATSRFVSQRIRQYYRRESTIVPPPVDTEFFNVERQAEDYYLMVSALCPYKRIDLAIDAFNALRRPLKIVGEGALRDKLKARAGPTIEFLGRVSDEQLRDYYAGCRALIMCAVEDFGIATLEANAAGRPVIALGRGGALDTVVPLNMINNNGRDREAQERFSPTGVFFYESTPESLREAVEYFEMHQDELSPQVLRTHAQSFDRKIFKQRMNTILAETGKRQATGGSNGLL